MLGQTERHQSRDLRIQFAERLWPSPNEPLVNRAFRSLDELEDVQAELEASTTKLSLKWFAREPPFIGGLL